MVDESRKNAWAQFAHYSHIGFILPAAAFIGWLIGGWLDRRLGTSWLHLAGLLIGVGAGFFDLVRTLMRATK